MEGKKRTLLAAAISCIILAAVLYSFFLSIFSNTAKIELADPSAVSSSPLDPSASGDQGGIVVEVTPDTVQSIIGSMERLTSYSRSITVQYYWGGTRSGTVTVFVQADGGYVRCDATLPGGTVEHSIVGGGTLWYWYNEEMACRTAAAAEGEADLLSRIPTYEDILALPRASITDAGYLQRAGISCIYVEAVPLEGYVERYWVSLDSGLLIASELEENGVLSYAMQADNMVSPLSPAVNPFLLPDGQVIY